MDLSLCSLCAQRLWGRAAAEEGRAILSQGMVATVTSEGQARARAQCEQRLLLCSVAVPTLLGQASPKMLEQNSESWVQIGSSL